MDRMDDFTAESTEIAEFEYNVKAFSASSAVKGLSYPLLPSISAATSWIASMRS